MGLLLHESNEENEEFRYVQRGVRRGEIKSRKAGLTARPVTARPEGRGKPQQKYPSPEGAYVLIASLAEMSSPNPSPHENSLPCPNPSLFLIFTTPNVA